MFWPPNILDLVAVVLLALGTLRGALRGLSGELARLVALVAAFAFGLAAYDPVAAWFLAHTRLEGRLATVVAFVGTLLGAVIALLLIRKVLKALMRVVIEEKFDKAAGAVAGFIGTSIVIVIVFVVLNMWPNDFLNRKFGEESVIGRVILRSMPELRAAGGAEDDGSYARDHTEASD